MFNRVPLILSLLVLFALGGAVSAEGISPELRSEMKARLIDHVERAFRSDNFVPVGSAKHREHDDLLTYTAYSSTGSVYQSLYVNADGSADYTCSYISSVVGYAVNYCIVAKNFAFKFQLTQSSCYNGVTQYFTDTACTNYVGMSSLYVDSTCAPSKDPEYWGSNAYQNIRCLTSGRPAFPNYDYIAEEQYDNSKCTGPYFSYSGYTSGKCFRHNGYYASYDCSTGVPRLNYYSTSSCTGSILYSTNYPTTCKQGDINVGDDDYTYIPPIIVTPPSASTTAFPTSKNPPATSSIAFCAAHAPTMQPNFWPTFYPTAAVAQTVTFDAEQVIDGIDYNTFTVLSLNQQVLIFTLTSAMTSVSASAVTSFQVSNGGRRRLQGADMALQATAGKSITITYTVTTSSIYSSTQLWNELSAAVSSGEFNTQLYVNANTVNAYSLMGCTSSAVYVPGSNDGTDSDSEDLPLSVGAIVGIVVGVVGGLCLITAFIVWLCVTYRRPRSAMAAQGAAGSDSNTPPAPYSPPAPVPVHAAPVQATNYAVPVQSPVSNA